MWVANMTNSTVRLRDRDLSGKTPSLFMPPGVKIWLENQAAGFGDPAFKRFEDDKHPSQKRLEEQGSYQKMLYDRERQFRPKAHAGPPVEQEGVDETHTVPMID